jgi:hypothetical protein
MRHYFRRTDIAVLGPERVEKGNSSKLCRIHGTSSTTYLEACEGTID